MLHCAIACRSACPHLLGFTSLHPFANFVPPYANSAVLEFWVRTTFTLRLRIAMQFCRSVKLLLLRVRSFTPFSRLHPAKIPRLGICLRLNPSLRFQFALQICAPSDLRLFGLVRYRSTPPYANSAKKKELLMVPLKFFSISSCVSKVVSKVSMNVCMSKNLIISRVCREVVLTSTHI